MPNPNNFNSHDDFMDSCIPQLIEEGNDSDQAIAICSQMWDDKGSGSTEKGSTEDEYKGSTEDDSSCEVIIEIIP